MSEVLKVENLRTYFHTKDGKLPAVDGVSFSLEAGKVLGIVGESGCGKSVTSLSIMGLLPPQTTEILPGSSVKLMGEELVGKSNREMCKIRGDKIAMIFQDSMTSLNPVMRVGDQLMETIRVHRKLTKKQAKQEAVAMLKKVGTYARQDMEKFFGCKINLKLWVKVKEDWRNREAVLHTLGYDKTDFNG